MAYIIDAEQKRRVETILTELVNDVKRRNTIKVILTSKDVKEAYQKEKEVLIKKVDELKNAMNPIIEKGWSLSENCPEFIKYSNIVEIYFILMFSEELDDIDLVSNYSTMEEVLNTVKGKNSDVAKRFYTFLKSGRLISRHLEEAMEEILF